MGHQVDEERISIADLIDNYDKGNLLECFGTGTAATVSPIGRVRYREREVLLDSPEDESLAAVVRDSLVHIMTGRAADPYGWVERL